MVQIHFKKSKCDQFGMGSDIVLGKTGLDLCPVTAILHCSSRQSVWSILAGLTQHIITKAWFVKRIRNILNNIGLPEQHYAGHSFRIGAAATAALVGS